MKPNKKNENGTLARREFLQLLGVFVIGTSLNPMSAVTTYANEVESDQLKKWKSLTPDQRNQIKNRWQRFQALSQEKKSKLRGALKRWQKFSPDKKQRITSNFRRWRNLPQKRRANIRKRFKRWKSFSPEKRKRIKNRFRKWRNLPPAERRQMRKQFRNRRRNRVLRRQQRRTIRKTR